MDWDFTFPFNLAPIGIPFSAKSIIRNLFAGRNSGNGKKKTNAKIGGEKAVSGGAEQRRFERS